MTQISSERDILLDCFENDHNTYELVEIPVVNFSYVQNHTRNITEQLQINHDIGTNTSNNAGKIAQVLDDVILAEEVTQMFDQVQTSESYWKTITERRHKAIQETNLENQQLHSLIDDLIKDNDKLRLVADHCHHLHKIFQTFIGENERTHETK